jgi:hypothetical protein
MTDSLDPLVRALLLQSLCSSQRGYVLQAHENHKDILSDGPLGHTTKLSMIIFAMMINHHRITSLTLSRLSNTRIYSNTTDTLSLLSNICSLTQLL